MIMSSITSGYSFLTRCCIGQTTTQSLGFVRVPKFGYREPLIITSIYEKEPEPNQPRTVPPPHDVLFADPYGPDAVLGTKDDDFRPAPGSLAIDAGTNETEPPLPAMDLDGNPRILNDIVDLGAYEFTG